MPAELRTQSPSPALTSSPAIVRLGTESSFLLISTATQNAALKYGGYSNSQETATEEYDGTSWSSGGALITATYGNTGAGSQNAGFNAGGTSNPSSDFKTGVELYNGTAWTSGPSLPTGIRYAASTGDTNNNVVTFGGVAPSGNTAATNEFTNVLVYSNLHCITRCLDATCTQI